MTRLYGGALHTHIRQGDVVARYPRHMHGQQDIVDALTACEEFSVYRALQGEHAPSVLHIHNDVIFLKYDRGNAFTYNMLDSVCLSYLSYYIQRIHSLRLPVPQPPTQRRLHMYKQVLQTAHMLYPPLQTAITWLLDNIPDFTPVTVHGDYKCDNVFDTGIVLDWEFAHMGDSHEDLAWFLLPIWHNGTLSPDQRQYFLCEYTRRTQTAICPQRLQYWTIFAYVRFATIACQQYKRAYPVGSLDLHMSGWRLHHIAHILAHQHHMGAYLGKYPTATYPTASEAIKCFYKNLILVCTGRASGKNLYNHTKKAFFTHLLNKTY